MPTNNVNINIRMNKELKIELDALCRELGLTVSSAMTIFAKTMVRQQRIPFDVGIETPNAETIAAMKEADAMIKNKSGKRYHSVAELMKDLNS